MLRRNPEPQFHQRNPTRALPEKCEKYIPAIHHCAIGGQWGSLLPLQHEQELAPEQALAWPGHPLPSPLRNHVDGKKEVRVDASLTDAELSGQVNSQIKKEILPKMSELFPNVDFQIKGQAERAADSGMRLGIAFLISIILIMVTISLNFKSFYQSRLILMVVPVGIFSALLGHGIVGKPFSTLSVWGVVALVGILVNDAVVMLDQYNKNLALGMGMKEAVLKAGKSRFRAIILTTITTVAGLYPLILEESFQAQFLIPMAISVAYGVLFGTLILLIYFPPLILYFNDIKRTKKWIWEGGKIAPTWDEVEPVIENLKRVKEFEE